MDSLLNFSESVISFALPLKKMTQSSTGFHVSALPYHQKISSFLVRVSTALPSQQQESPGKAWYFFLASNIGNSLCSVKTQRKAELGTKRVSWWQHRASPSLSPTSHGTAGNDHNPTLPLRKQLLTFCQSPVLFLHPMPAQPLAKPHRKLDQETSLLEK